VYFTNSAQGIFGRLALTPDGKAAGTPAELLAHAPQNTYFDDFALRDGTAYVANLGVTNGVSHVGPDRNATMLATSSPESGITQVTSAAFGGAVKDRNVLYFVTAGKYIGSNLPAVGGQVFSLDVGC
jgi:sugar lactone lactonase YvrE